MSFFSFSEILHVQACSSDEHEIIVKRYYAKNAGEIVQLYSGDSANLRNTLVFNDESDASQDTVADYKVCIDGYTDYNLELMSKNSPTWADGSLITLTYNEIILVRTSLSKDGNEKKVIKLNLSSLVDSRMNWRYSTKVDAASWKEKKIKEFGEDYNNKEIKNAGSSVYFRKDITVDNSFAVLQLSIQSQSGFIVYVNGIQVYTYLLPESSKINENTPSQSLVDTPAYKHIIVSKELLGSSVSLTTLKIAIELHTKEDHLELLSSFDALTYITNPKDSIDTLSIYTSRRLLDTNEYTMILFEDNQSIDFSTIVSPILSNCVLSPDLPIGLTISSNGILSGTPKEVKSAEYTLSYNYGDDASFSDTYKFNLKILCNPINCAHIRVNRITFYYASYEKVVIKSEDGNEIDTLIQNDNTKKNYDYYGPVGTWSFELLIEINGVWSNRSMMTVYIIDDLSDTSIPVTRIRTISKSHETYYVNTNYSMLMRSEWKYNTYDSLPTEWYGSSADDSSWFTIIGGTIIFPSGINQYFVFRKTIHTPSIVNQKYFILNYKTVSNTKIYINNHELSTHRFKDGYLDSTDSSTIIEQTATGRLSLFDNQDTITISVLLYDKQNTIDISFDASLIMAVDTSLPVYGDFDVTLSNYFIFSNDDSFLDLNIKSFISIVGNGDKSSPIISIATKDGYKYINRYCITYPSNNFEFALTSWKVESIDINGYRHEHSVVADAFTSSNDPRRKCFFLSDVTTGINQLEFTLMNNIINKAKNDYTISEIELFVDDITSDILPSLVPFSNPYYAYDNTTLSISFTNSEYYHDFTITPSLPDGLTFDTTTGSIYGIIHGENGNTDYTIHATSVFNTPYEYILTISIQLCQFPYNFVSIQVECEEKTFYSIDIRDSTTFVLSKRIYHLYKKNLEEYNLCLSPSLYYIFMYIYYGDFNSVSHIYVNNNYYTKCYPSHQIDLYFTQYVDASKMRIVYSYDNNTPPKHWTTSLFNDNLWSTVPSSSSLPDVPNSSITQYYRIHYNIEVFMELSRVFDITVSTYAGMIIYINGYEVRRVNMNDGDNIEYNTLATDGYTEYKSFRSVISAFIDPNICLIGDNIIAIEIHRYNNIIQPNSGLSIKISIIEKNNLSIEGSWSVNGNVVPEYPLNNLYDFNDDTYTKVLNKCSNTIFTYTYNDEICVDVNQLHLYYRHDMSVSYSPESIVIEGTYNNGAQWDELSTMDGIIMNTIYNQDLYLNKCYNSYRMILAKCGTDPSLSESESVTILNELQYYVNDIPGCISNEWSATRFGIYSSKICPKGYSSDAKRLCIGYGSQAIEGDPTCIKINPSKLYFEETDIIIKKDDFYEQYYTIDAVDTVITSSPSLPEGIIIDSVTQKLYGTHINESPKTTYTLSYTNNEGTIVDLYQISITVIGLPCLADNNWPETNSDSTASLPCPQGYAGKVYRLCSIKSEWEEVDTSECIFSSTPCTGTTYYNGNECIECINGYVISLNGNNYLCTPCNNNEFVYNNKCYPSGATCPASTIDSYLYPETDILKNAAVNCTNENQYGYYKVFCDYISKPTWSNDIHKDLCYPRPVSIPGKALESLDYFMQLAIPIDDIYSLLSIDSLLLHVYYGSSRYLYSIYSSSKRQLFINTIITYYNTPFSSSSSLSNYQTILYNTNEYCHYLESGHQDVLLSYYKTYVFSIGEQEYYEILFCKQIQLDYVLVPIKIVEIPNRNIKCISLVFDNSSLKWIGHSTFIAIYRSFLISSKVPISQLYNFVVTSLSQNIKTILYLKYLVNFPNEILVESATLSSYFNEQILKKQLKNIIPFSYSSVEIEYQEI
ncbi:hypothetical protein WA158_003016 [Blastocystis sp. Blastoise]